MSRPSPVHAMSLIASLVLGAAAMAADEPRAEFTANAGDYDAPFGEASAAIKQIVLDEGFEVVGVADFTDLAGQPLQIGRLYAEEFATRLVGPRKKYRLLDPATLLGLVEASGGTSLWATPEKIKQFGAKSKVELVVTGRIEIAAKEARFFIKAIATEDAGVVWAKTIAVPGVSAAAAAEAAKAEADAIAAQTRLVPQPLAADATSTDALAITVGSLFTGDAAAPSSATSAPASASTGATTAAATPPVAASTTPASGASVATTAPTSSPAATTAPVATAAAATAITAAAASPAPQSAAPTTSPKPAAPAPTNPTPAVTAPVSSAASGAASTATAALATAAVAVTAAAASPAPAPAPKPVATPPPLPPEVLTFENAWLRARVRSASKYEGSGWVTAVLDLTNLSDRPIKLDAAQDDPGKGVDELGNNWRIERVSGLKLASGSGSVNTVLNPSSTVSVVVVLATSAQPSGRRLSFGPNLYWFGSGAVGDSGRVAVAFSNIRVN